jgi:hypothetical protein
LLVVLFVVSLTAVTASAACRGGGHHGWHHFHNLHDHRHHGHHDHYYGGVCTTGTMNGLYDLATLVWNWIYMPGVVAEQPVVVEQPSR